jgi:hypothetical protein
VKLPQKEIMKPAIHYAFRAKLIRFKKENGEFDFIDVFQEFFDDEPMKAREAAFKYYQNYIDVLLESKGLKYESDDKAREEMDSFWDPQTTHMVDIGGELCELPASYGNGIGVFLVIDDEFDKTDNSRSMIIIHGIGYLTEEFWDPDSAALNLRRETQYYKHFNYETGNYLTSVLLCSMVNWISGDRENEPQQYIILKTPFDWTDLDKPNWWGDLSDVEEDIRLYKLTESFDDMLAGGETNQVEFKPSLLYNFKSKTAGIGVKGIIAKSICAFLNSNGGFLFIGVDNEGTPKGLAYDFKLAGDKDPHDYFRLEFDETIYHFLPSYIKDCISGDFIEVNGVEIFMVTVHPSKSKPIFFTGQHGKEFYVRWTACNKQYIDIEEVINYCLIHWNKET